MPSAIIAPEGANGLREASIDRLVTPDLEVLDDAIEGLPLRVERLGRAMAPVDLVRVAVAERSLLTCRVGGALRTVGETRNGLVTLGLPLEPSDATWNGHELDPATLWIYGAGAEHEGVARTPPSFASLTVTADVLASAHEDAPARRGLSVMTGPTVLTLGRALAGVGSLPADTPAHQLARAFTEVEEALSEALAAADRCERVGPSAAAHIVGECIALGELIGPQPALGELSSGLGFSKRWIRAAFAKELGVPPGAYFRIRALHGARRDLLRSAPGGTTVTETALDWGFWHLGRFSVSYRALFGEQPSQSLRRDRPRVAPRATRSPDRLDSPADGST